MTPRDGPRHLILSLMADGREWTTRDVARALRMDYVIVRRSMYNMKRDGLLESGGTKLQETWWKLKRQPVLAQVYTEPRKWWEVLWENR